MKNTNIKEISDRINDYKEHLYNCELSERTINKYITDIKKFLVFVEKENKDIDKDVVLEYKKSLSSAYKTTSVNSYLISVNGFLKWLDLSHLSVKLIKCQQRYFIQNTFEIKEYYKMLDYAKKNMGKKWYLIMQCLGGTGMRVGELKFLTVESVSQNCVSIHMKGKLRQILLPSYLSEKLKEYCKEQKIEHGVIFMNRKRTSPLDASVIWRNIKHCAKEILIDDNNVYPHNFRHMFARNYINKYNNLLELADILGHSSLETTRIYTRSCKEVQIERINNLFTEIP